MGEGINPRSGRAGADLRAVAAALGAIEADPPSFWGGERITVAGIGKGRGREEIVVGGGAREEIVEGGLERVEIVGGGREQERVGVSM